MDFEALLISTLYVVITLYIGRAIRRYIEANVATDLSRLLCLEFVATAEMCASGFELLVIAEAHGLATYAVYLFILTIYFSKSWGEATACPYIYIENYLNGDVYFSKAFLAIAAEVAGGLAVFQYVNGFWSFGYEFHHVGRSVWVCDADLQVTVLQGALIEGVATCLCRLASRALSDIDVSVGPALDSFIGTSLVCAAWNYSGGYFNPALATSLKFGCRGHTGMEHFVVYWIGATIGALVAQKLYQLPTLKSLLTGGLGPEVKKD